MSIAGPGKEIRYFVNVRSSGLSFGFEYEALYIEIERFVVIAICGGNCGFSGEAAVALRLGPCSLDRPPAFFANTVEYHRRESLHHKVGFARVQGRGTGVQRSTGAAMKQVNQVGVDV